MINRSTYYDGKEFKHEDRVVRFQRAWGGCSFHGNFLIVIGEEQLFQETHYYILAEAQLNDLSEMPGAIRQLTAEYKVEQWLGMLDDNLREFFAISNQMASRSGFRTVYITDVPRIREYIDTQVDLVIGLIKPLKRLHFFGQSMLPAEMNSVPTKKIKAEEYPKIEALANVITGMLKYAHENIPDSFLVPEVEPDY